MTADEDRAAGSGTARMPALHIGPWRAEVSTNRLSRDGRSLHIEPKAMEVLLLLAERPGQVVGREEILTRVWAGSVVGDDALTQAVIKLRRALGDDSRAPAYIETIAKRGYRLIAPVATEPEVPAGGEPRAETEAVPPDRPPRRRRARLFLAGALAGVVALSAYIAPFWRDTGQDFAVPAGPGTGDSGWGSVATLTVQPFEALGEGVPDYLARGIAADLSTDLGRVGALRIIQAPAAGAAGDTSYVARYVVSGSVQGAGERLRINVWLLDAASGHQLWSERLERPLGDLASLQVEMVARLAAVLPLQVGEAELRRLAARHTRNVEAYELFLQGYGAHLAHLPEENRQARAFYLRALELDPRFARAYAGLAMTWANEYRYQWGGEGEQALARASQLAHTALQIDPDLREGHWVMAYVHMQWHQPEQALGALRRAVELDPSYADAYGLMGAVHVYAGQPAKALPPLRYGMRLAPDAGYLYYMSVGEAYFFLGDYELALVNLGEALARNPVNLETRVFLAAALAAVGRSGEADWEAEEIRVLAPGFALPDWLETSPLTDRRGKRRIVELLRPYGL